MMEPAAKWNGLLRSPKNNKMFILLLKNQKMISFVNYLQLIPGYNF